MSNLTLALDAMSGDFGPRQVVPAALQILSRYSNVQLYLIGALPQITPFIPSNYSHQQRLHLLHTDHVITQEMTLKQALQQRENSSMQKAIELVQTGVADACVSAGNTAALMGLSMLMIQPIPGIRRPALISTLPTINHQPTVMLDLGANTQSNETMLMQFASMGSIFVQSLFNIEHPKISLLNIGKEEVKGSETIRNVAAALHRTSEMNFQGYIEGNELFLGETNVVVCDGFVGNVTLKAVEGFAALMRSTMKKGGHPPHWIGRLISQLFQKKISKSFGHLDPNRYNGASLLGLQGVVVKSHGAADAVAFISAIEQAMKCVECQIPDQIAMHLSSTLLKSK